MSRDPETTGESHPTDGSKETGFSTEEVSTVRNVREGFRIRVNSKRGTGTRDQDEITLESCRPTLDEAVEEIREAIGVSEAELFPAARANQPDAEDD